MLKAVGVVDEERCCCASVSLVSGAPLKFRSFVHTKKTSPRKKTSPELEINPPPEIPPLPKSRFSGENALFTFFQKLKKMKKSEICGVFRNKFFTFFHFFQKVKKWKKVGLGPRDPERGGGYF